MRVAFLGLGIMGSRMAANLARAGFELTVWNRTRSTAEAFCSANRGVQLAESPALAGSRSEAVLTMVVDGDQVTELLLGDQGAATMARPGTLFVDCSTIGPLAARTIGSALADRGMEMVDAPVTGSSPRAEDGTLTIMVGGSDEAFARARPLLEAMGKVIVHAGALGQGQVVKVVNNAVAATNAAVLGEALLVGARAGADLDALVQVMAAGSGASTMLTLKADPMRRHDYTTLFKLERSSSGEEVRTEKAFFKLDHMLKDVRLCLEHADTTGLALDFARMTEQVLQAASEMGHGEHDFAALINALESRAGIRLGED